MTAPASPSDQNTPRPDAAQLAAAVRAMVRQHGPLGPALLTASQGLFAPLHGNGSQTGSNIHRDIAYGVDPRHRLDVFEPKARTQTPRPVLIYVHGGGFVRGDKHGTGTPFYENVGLWACRNGMIGVTINYRLAPQHVWPAGTEDVAAATRWVAANAARFGGDPERIVLFGHSAGAVHVANYVAHQEFHGAGGIGIAGAVLGSGIYDLTDSVSDAERMYFGKEPEQLAARSSVTGLLETSVPLLVFLSELDPVIFDRQALGFAIRFAERHQRLPRFVCLAGESHLSPVMHLGYDPGDRLGPELVDFIQTECRSP